MDKKYGDGYRSKRSPDRSRLLAVETLRQVESEDAFSNLLLPRTLRAEQRRNPKFTFRDAAFTSELVYGTIRQKAYLDTVLAEFSSRPLDELDPLVKEILRVGAYQILFLRVPDHAAVAATVDVARSLTSDGPTRMVNAVLRAITRATPEEIEGIFERHSARTERLAARLSHPEWMVRGFETALTARGLPSSELEDVLAANNVNPKVNLVARPGLISAQELADEASEVLGRPTSQGEVSEHAVVLEGGDPAALPSVRTGVAAVQDQGSQLAGMLLAEAPLSGTDERWLDLCAGPGGKTALLAALGAGSGVEVTAVEINPRRAKLVERSVQALENVRVEAADGRTLPMPEAGPFDRVLVDAPCTGLGSLRRRPESRWRHQEEDLAELVDVQRDLFKRGVQLTRPGGVIAWVTCTPLVEETLHQVQEALDRGGVTLIDAVELAEPHVVADLRSGVDTSELTQAQADLVRQTVQLWPHRHGSDAMFIALLRKNEEED